MLNYIPQDKTLVTSNWTHGAPKAYFTDIIDFLENNKVETFIYNALPELDFSDFLPPDYNYSGFFELLNQVDEVCLRKNIDSYLLIGTAQAQTEYNERVGFKKIKIYNFPLYWFWATQLLFQYYDKIETQDPSQCDKLFVCLNNKAKQFRYNLINELYVENLLDNGYVSWKGNRDIVTRAPIQVHDWKIEEKKLSFDFKEDVSSIEVPKEYFKAAIDLIPETSIKYIFFTEKLVRALMYKKVFLVYGACNYHHTLEKYGFKMYRELIDYSFDKEPDDRKRAKMLIEQIKKIDNLEYSEIYNICKSNIEHNFFTLININNVNNNEHYNEEIYPIRETVRNTYRYISFLHGEMFGKKDMFEQIQNSIK